MSTAKANATPVTFAAATEAWPNVDGFRVYAANGTTAKTGILDVLDPDTGTPTPLEVANGAVPQIPTGGLSVPMTGLDADYMESLLDTAFVDGDLTALYDASGNEITAGGYAREAIDWAAAATA